MSRRIFTGFEGFSTAQLYESAVDTTYIDDYAISTSHLINRLSTSSGRTNRSTILTTRNSNELHSSLNVQIQSLELVFKDLTYSVTKKTRAIFKKNRKVQTKEILHSLNGKFRPGRLTAILGPSGAGKTSLLDCLAGNLLGGQLSGQVLVNGDDFKGKKIKDISGFVFSR